MPSRAPVEAPPEPTGGTGTGTGIVQTGTGAQSGVRGDQRRSVEHAEHLGDVRRFRAGLLITAPTWCAFGMLDWIAATWAGDGWPTLVWFWTIRVGLLPLVAFSFWGAFRATPPSPRLLRILETFVYTAASFGIATMAVRYHGITSTYVPGILMAIVGRGAFTNERWTRALPSNLLMASAFPIVMGIASFFVPAIRAQLSDPVALATAVHYLFYLYGTMVMMLVASHHAWSLRRQLFESRSIGRYRLKKKIAAGGMGEVWAAYHPGLKRDVALKMLRADASTNDPAAVARFEREVKATSELSHPNTIRVFDFGVTDDGIFYYAMELLEGMTLADLVRTEGPIDPARAVHLVTQAARAIAEAHERGIVHRDIKPANLFLTVAGGEPDFVKVLDFGIAKRAADADATEEDAIELTSTGMLAGTPKYTAPELVSGAQASPRSDIYGLGAVLYFLLAGRTPFEGDSRAAIYSAALLGELELPSVVRGSPLPGELEAIVLRALARDPAVRFATAGELAQALGKLTLGKQTLRYAPQPTWSIPPPAVRQHHPDDTTVVPIGARKDG